MSYDNNFAHIDSLVEKIKNNDSESLFVLFDYYKPLIDFAVNQLVKKYKGIEKDDLMSDSIFILKDLCLKYDKDKCYFTYFLETRFRPYLISKIKSNYLSKIDIVSLNDIDESYVMDDEFLSNYEPIKEIIENLSPQQRKVIELFYFCNLTQAECAKILEISQPAFSKKLKNVIKIIKKSL
jgi:RNA polymerase sigma-70 factor (ECF subfamily)